MDNKQLVIELEKLELNVLSWDEITKIIDKVKQIAKEQMNDGK